MGGVLVGWGGGVEEWGDRERFRSKRSPNLKTFTEGAVTTGAHTSIS